MEFTVEKADSQEFAHWWVVYRDANEDFSQSFSEQYQDIKDVPFCHWILSDGQRVGGLIMVGNNIGDFFLIPPFNDSYSALKAILPADGKLVAQGILSEHVEALQLLGFEVKESRRWMLRPTQAYDVSFDLQQSRPQAEQADTIAQLMFDAFSGTVGGYGARDVEAHRKSVDSYFENVETDSVFYHASSLLFDGEKMVGACLVEPYKTIGSIRFVVTHPDYQRRGIARRLMQHGINIIKDEVDYVGLAVTIGSPAQGLYRSMGFLSGVVMYTMVRE